MAHAASMLRLAPAELRMSASERGGLVDINTATPDQLKSLPGIGDVYVKRIIEGRPYTAKNQLVRRGVIPQEVYGKIAEKIVARRVRKK